MWTRNLKCSLKAVVLFACVFLAGSGRVSAGAHDGAGVLQDAEDIPGAHERHKGIRSYGSTGFPHDNNANRGVKSYGTPSGHGASHDHGIKDGDHGYNKNGDGCSKCKWENDDYWEHDEPEEEGDENDGDDCDDGQYRSDKTHHHSPSRGHKLESRPSGVHKTGPTGVYVNDGVQRSDSPGGPSGGINYPTSTGYTRPISGYETTPKPGSGWNTPFADTLKPGHGGVTAGAFGTTPSSWPDWNRGTTPNSYGSPQKPAWAGGHGRAPSSQGPSASFPNFGTTSKPGQGWNNQFPSGSSSAIPHTGSGISSPSSYGNPQENQNKPYGQPGTQNTYAGAYAGASVTSGIGSFSGEPSNFGRKDQPFNSHEPVNTQTPHGPHGGIDQATASTDNYNLMGYNPEPDSHSIRPPIVTNTFGTTKGPYGGIGSSRIPGAQENPFAPGGSPGSPSGSGIHQYPGVTKPSYSGSTTSWLGPGQTGSGSSTWHDTRTTPHTGFGTTKTPFGHVNVPSSTLSAPYDRTRPRQPGFNVASSSATASASASAFGISPGTYSIPSTGTTSFYDTTPSHRGSSSYTPGVKGSIERSRPAYGTVPHGARPNIESGTWPGGQPGSSTGPWPGKPEDGSGITSGRHSPSASGILPSKQPQGVSGTWSTGQPAGGSGAWPNKQSGGGSGTWPGQKQPGHGSEPGCLGGNCGGTTGPQEGSNCGGCCGNSNCDGGCSGRGNVPATHGLCGGGPSEVNKTYYPTGTGDGNVPNIGAVYGPDSRLNTGAIYPQTPGASVTSKSPMLWNSANPFLYQTGGGTPSSVSRPWTETTDKPLGKGNPFLDSSWSDPRPGYGNAYNDRNVIPHGEGNTKPIGQGNVFLDGSNRREEVGTNPNESVIPLGGKIPKGNNPFLRPLTGGSSGSGNPLYGKYPDRSGTPGNFPGSRTPGNYPGLGTPGSYPGSGISGRGEVSANPNEGVIPLGGKIPKGNNPFLRPLIGGSSGSGNPSYGKYPDRSGTPGNYPGSGTPGSYPGSGTPGRGEVGANPNEGVIPLGGKIPEGNNPFLRPLIGGSSSSGSPSYGKYPSMSETPESFPGAGIPGSSPGSGTPGNYPGSGTLGNYPGSGTPGNYPGSGTLGSFPGSGTPGNYPRSGTPENYPGSETLGNYPGLETPGNFPGSGIPGNYPKSGIPGSGGYGGVKSDFHSGGISPQDGNRSYPTGSNLQSAGPLECKLGLFGCGTSGSGSYAGNKHPGEGFGGIGGNVGAGTGNPGVVGNVSGRPGNPGISLVSSAGHPGSGGNNLAASGAQAGAYAGSFSSAQASSSSFAGSFSDASGPANNFGGNLSPNGAQNQGGSNSWASSGASAFASSSAGNWPGNRPIDVKG